MGKGLAKPSPLLCAENPEREHPQTDLGVWPLRERDRPCLPSDQPLLTWWLLGLAGIQLPSAPDSSPNQDLTPSNFSSTSWQRKVSMTTSKHTDHWCHLSSQRMRAGKQQNPPISYCVATLKCHHCPLQMGGRTPLYTYPVRVLPAQSFQYNVIIKKLSHRCTLSAIVKGQNFRGN